jgi:hypothetical protein
MARTKHFKVLVFLYFLFSSAILFSQAKTEKYNILWLSCEDIDPILSCYGTKNTSCVLALRAWPHSMILIYAELMRELGIRELSSLSRKA